MKNKQYFVDFLWPAAGTANTASSHLITMLLICLNG